MTLLIEPPGTATRNSGSVPVHLTRERRLTDSFGRNISDMRISITDRCNFRCVYCMPEEGMQWLKRETLLSFDEIERLTRIAVELGIEEVRLTGGEPTLRPDLPQLVQRLSKIDIRSLSLTTNGFLLRTMAGPLAEAGLTRINVSLDTLQHDRFHQIARRRGLDEVLAGLEALEQYPTISPIKVNVVAMRDFTEAEVVAFAQLARRKPYNIRFIEFMPLDADHAWSLDRVLTGEEIRAAIHEVFPLEAEPREPSATARVYRFADGHGRIGFINPVSEPFCGDCDRLRLTADGKLRTCLFSLRETDLRGPMRAGASDAELERVIRDAVWRKELKHRVNEPGFVQPARTMSAIGG
jgi:GTP 3',8-cyclase